MKSQNLQRMDKTPETSKVEREFTSLDHDTGDVTVEDVMSNSPKRFWEAVTGPKEKVLDSVNEKTKQITSGRMHMGHDTKTERS